LDEAEEILCVVFPANKHTSLSVNPREESFHQPVALIVAQPTAILGLAFNSILPVGRHHFNAVVFQFFIPLVTTIHPIANQLVSLAWIM
jgi:hypothetical protein